MIPVRLQRGRYNLPNQKLTEARKMLVSWDDENISLQLILLVLIKRREWMGMGVAGMIITSDYGSFPKIPCVKRTSKSCYLLQLACNVLAYVWHRHGRAMSNCHRNATGPVWNATDGGSDPMVGNPYNNFNCPPSKIAAWLNFHDPKQFVRLINSGETLLIMVKNG